jgi:hypothetical protein
MANACTINCTVVADCPLKNIGDPLLGGTDNTTPGDNTMVATNGRTIFMGCIDHMDSFLDSNAL